MLHRVSTDMYIGVGRLRKCAAAQSALSKITIQQGAEQGEQGWVFPAAALSKAQNRIFSRLSQLSASSIECIVGVEKDTLEK